MKKTNIKSIIIDNLFAFVLIIGCSAIVFRISQFNGFKELHPLDEFNIRYLYLMIFREIAIVCFTLVPLVISINTLWQEGNSVTQYILLCIQIISNVAGMISICIFCNHVATDRFFIAFTIYGIIVLGCVTANVIMKKYIVRTKFK